MTRFIVQIMPRDGSKHHEVMHDIDLLILPQMGDVLQLMDGLTVEVSDVTIAPTQDPIVIVRGRTLYPADVKECKTMLEALRREEGWQVR